MVDDCPARSARDLSDRVSIRPCQGTNTCVTHFSWGNKEKFTQGGIN